MKTFNYAPASPIKDNITMLAVSVGMVVVPLVYPFGIRIGSTRILGPYEYCHCFYNRRTRSLGNNIEQGSSCPCFGGERREKSLSMQIV